MQSPSSFTVVEQEILLIIVWSDGTKISDWLASGTRKTNATTTNLNTVRSRTTNHKFLKSLLVTPNACRTNPPLHFEHSVPRLSIQANNAKNVPSIPTEQSRVFRTIIGVHRIRATIRVTHSSNTTNNWSGIFRAKFHRRTKMTSRNPATP